MGVTLVRPGPLPPLDLDRLHLDSFSGRRVAVLGFARSGIALARFLADRGADVTVYDGRPPEVLRAAIEALEGRDVRLQLGPDADPAAVLDGQELVCTSPAISSRYPTTEPRLRAALAAVEAGGRVPVVSEVDLFLRLCSARTVGVTGTKGKTTTASLCAAVLGAGAAPVLLGGNIGTPLVERLPEITARHVVVLELSELQLPTLSRGTTVAVYTHVTQDHLDRHGSVEAYRAAKRLLAELVDPAGALVLNADDPVSADYAPGAPTARTVRYTRSSPSAGTVGVENGWIRAANVMPLDDAPLGDVPPARTNSVTVGRMPATLKPEGSSQPTEVLPREVLSTEVPMEVPPAHVPVLPLAEIPLPGEHNVSNVLAAVSVGVLFGVAPSGIRREVARFGGVEHRLETVAVVDGVRFVNDSQGTQPDAVIAALRSFDRPLVLIAGGQDKGLSFEELALVAVERADAVVLIGENAPKLKDALETAGHPWVERADGLGAAVVRADAIARGASERGRHRGATVLLSPAAASFDMFEDYAARGEAFKRAVADVLAARTARAHEEAPS